MKQMEAEIRVEPGEDATVQGKLMQVHLPAVLWADYKKAAADLDLSLGEFVSYLAYIGARTISEEGRAAAFNAATAPVETETVIERCASST